MFTRYQFDSTKNKIDFYRGKDCSEKFCKDLREHATKIINYEKKRNDSTNLVLTKMTKMHLNYTIKWEIIVSTEKTFEELLTVFVI